MRVQRDAGIRRLAGVLSPRRGKRWLDLGDMTMPRRLGPEAGLSSGDGAFAPAGLGDWSGALQARVVGVLAGTRVRSHARVYVGVSV